MNDDEGEDFWLSLDEKTKAKDEKTKAKIEEGLRDFDQGRHVDFFEYMKLTYGISRTERNDESQN
ncbi:hypothetical protein [Dyadobacter arcticus]|uniref:Transcriptional regulator n=1 Tax=Dyadobacter arcticus TaxID=1078754 RepID=A0ABX0UDU1_9BACT|nr:hypothetical protein [Dyadobacter arcticus]NIJ51087.1 putative transcriptional regulator [Dyadobacter arcticus]